MEGLDSVARRYGVRPSALLAEEDPFVALAIDLWAHNWGVQHDAYIAAHPPRRRKR